MAIVTTVTHSVVIVAEQRQAVRRYECQHVDAYALRLRNDICVDNQLSLQRSIIALQDDVELHILQIFNR